MSLMRFLSVTSSLPLVMATECSSLQYLYIILDIEKENIDVSYKGSFSYIFFETSYGSWMQFTPISVHHPRQGYREYSKCPIFSFYKKPISCQYIDLQSFPISKQIWVYQRYHKKVNMALYIRHSKCGWVKL